MSRDEIADKVSVTIWQIKFAARFWTDRLRENPQITDAQADRFEQELSDLLEKREPAALCTVVRPQMNLVLALHAAELPENALPLSEIDLVFVADGTIRIA